MADTSSRGFNWQIVAGFLLSPIVFLSYPLFFLRHPITRDVPWANLLLLLLSAWLLFVGVRRAFTPGRFRAMKAGAASLAALVGVFFLGYFLFVFYVASHDLPASAGAPQVGQKAPVFTATDVNSAPVTLASLLASPVSGSTARPPKAVLLVFYMYRDCMSCNSELRSIQQNLAEFEANGIKPVAVSTDAPDISRVLVREAGYTFTFLSDPNREVIRQYDLLMPEHGNMARPAAFLVDNAGTVRWRNITESMFVRAKPSAVIAASRTF